MVSHRIACHKCRFVWEFEPPLSRRAECPNCRTDAKVCLNCCYFDSGAHHECREEQAEWVKEKASGNFCGFFMPKGAAGEATAADKARAKLDQLFGSQAEEPIKKGGSLADELQRFLGSKK